VASYVLRVWLPDRPGALGAVASRVGAVGGDVVGIEILERGGGRAIDELVIDLPDPELVSLLLEEVRCVDGVDVEEIRPVPAGRREPDMGALETAELLVSEDSPRGLVDGLVLHVGRQFDAGWGVVIDLRSREAVAVSGRPPPVPWLVAFVEGSQASVHAVGAPQGASDVAWAVLPEANAAVVFGREGRPYHERERRQLELLTRIADHRLGETTTSLRSRLLHPSAS
jgi:ACT domain